MVIRSHFFSAMASEDDERDGEGFSEEEGNEEDELEAATSAAVAFGQEPQMLEVNAKNNVIVYQMRGLFVGYAGLEYLSRVAQQSFLYDKSKADELNMQAETLFACLGRYNAVIEMVDSKNLQRINKMSNGRGTSKVEEMALDLFAAKHNDRGRVVPLTAEQAAVLYLSGKVYDVGNDRRAKKEGGRFYSETLHFFAHTFHIEPDTKMAAAWFGFNLSLAQGYKAAYEVMRLMIQDVNKIYGWDFFKINRSDYAAHLEDLKYENIRGDQTTSIDTKAMLQLIVYGAWNNLMLDDPLPINTGKGLRLLTLADIFDMAGQVDALGWLKEYHKLAFERRWEEIHPVFHILSNHIRGPLMSKFQSQIEDMEEIGSKFKPNLQRIEGDYSCAFQLNTDYSWMGGALPLNLEFEPYPDFEIAPIRNASNISFLGGNPGCLAGDQEIITAEGFVKIGALTHQKLVKVLSLGPRGLEYIPAIPIRTGRRKLYRVTTSSGNPILASAEHKFMLASGNGWCRVSKLRKGSKIVAAKESSLRAVQARIHSEVLLDPEKILFARLFRGRATTESDVELSQLLQRNVDSSMFRKNEEVLFAELYNNISKQSLEPDKDAWCHCETTRELEEMVRQCTSRAERSSFWKYLGKSQAGGRNCLGSYSQGGTLCDVETILQIPSGAITEQSIKTEPHDIFGERRSQSARSLGTGVSLEQMSSHWRSILLSGFPNCWDEVLDRVQWKLLAPRHNERPSQKDVVGIRGVFPDCAGRSLNQDGFLKDFEIVTVVSIESLGEADTFDLHVVGTNNYFLTNGVLSHNSGKTTLLSALACLGVLREGQVVFIPRSDDYNWPTTAFLPQMEIEGHKKDNLAYYFNRDIGIKPQGVPTIILDIVKDLDQLVNVPLTKYDRIIRVDAYSSFELDMNLVMKELRDVAAEFGYSDTRGIIAVRNLSQASTSGQDENSKQVSYDLITANTILSTFLKWRVNNPEIPMRIQLDEAADTNTAQTKSGEQFRLKETIEKAIRAARRGNMCMEIATQLANEISTAVKSETVNNFFKNLKENRDRKKSQLESMLQQLDLDEETKLAVKSLQRDPNFVNSRAIFWHSTRLQRLSLIYTMPPTFAPQIPSMSTGELYRYYLRKNRDVADEAQFLMKEPEVWIDLTNKHDDDDDQSSGQSLRY